MMKHYKSNDELFKEYKINRDYKLRNQIALNNKNLIYPIINKLFIVGINDYEELEQEAFIALLKAVEDFNPDLGYQFSTYASKCLMRITRRRSEYNQDVSLDEKIKNTDDDTLTLIDTIEDETIEISKDLEHKDLADKVKNILNEEEYEIIKYIFFDELTISKISIIKGKSRDVISLIRDKALRKLANNPYFKEYSEYESSKYNISYLRAYDYSQPKVQTSNISSPVWNTILQIEKRDNEIMKSIFYDSKRITD